jgi:putative acetyltransferase
MDIVLIDYETRYHGEFKRLNLEWLERFHLLESHDLELLDHPVKLITSRGGFVFLARVDEAIVGTAGLLKLSDGEYELVKMSVAPDFRGKGISKLLLEKCIGKARELGARKLVLFSNSQLAAAIHLYLKYGFCHVPVLGAPFVTADVKMELELLGSDKHG